MYFELLVPSPFLSLLCSNFCVFLFFSLALKNNYLTFVLLLTGIHLALGPDCSILGLLPNTPTHLITVGNSSPVYIGGSLWSQSNSLFLSRPSWCGGICDLEGKEVVITCWERFGGALRFSHPLGSWLGPDWEPGLGKDEDGSWNGAVLTQGYHGTGHNEDPRQQHGGCSGTFAAKWFGGQKTQEIKWWVHNREEHLGQVDVDLKTLQTHDHAIEAEKGCEPGAGAEGNILWVIGMPRLHSNYGQQTALTICSFL